MDKQISYMTLLLMCAYVGFHALNFCLCQDISNNILIDNGIFAVCDGCSIELYTIIILWSIRI